MMRLFMFPGQGSQFPGMATPLLINFPYLKELFEEAEDASKLQLRKICSDTDQEGELKKTANQQPAILLISIACWEVLKKEAEIEKLPGFFSGHSLGEYSALVASQKLSFWQAVSLVSARGIAMQEAVPIGCGTMAAVMRCPVEELLSHLKAFKEERKNQDFVLEVVNYNSPQQQIISGHKKAVDDFCSKLKKLKLICKDLPVSAPFHSSLMSPAKEKMRGLLEATSFLDSQTKIFTNLTAKIEDPYKADFLINQIDNPVLWEPTVNNAYNSGVRSFIEIGPGAVLCQLIKRFPMKDVLTHNSKDLQSLINKIQQLSL
ncbi:MAG: malonyl CoA-acyl carrier protein transacylase [Zetaproteobacteria bacterium]|nr:malonyl CoA-acyl carrier protein transacylase [Pseudobdellovibrionaceae bacterium]|tara:strand:+ start:964 stop:1917 length:954 start_codon:yes stop_codon:yes gene_type:complete